jgi:hypothetical protein
MSGKARIALWVGIGVGLCMVLYPPWMLMTLHGFEFFAYCPLWQPPDEGARIDWIRLSVQWLVTALATAGLMFVLNRKVGNSRRGSG